MTNNYVHISPDGKEMTIFAGDGRFAVLGSARPDGFTAEDIEKARTFELKSKMIPGQINRARRIPIGRDRELHLHCNTGPPTWWYPRVHVNRSRIMVGWYRALVALHWGRTPADD